MDIRHLEIFVTVVEENSITKAAQKLLMAQPAVSLAIKKLEEFYNTQLFLRLKQRIYLTNKGKLLYQKATQLIEDFHNLNLNSQTENKIKIGSSISIAASLLPQVLPKEKFNLTIRTTTNIIDLVENDTLDFGLIEGLCYNDKIAVVPLFNDQLVLVSTKKYYPKNTMQMQELNSFSFLLRDKGSGTRDYFDSILKTKELVIKPTIDSLSFEALLNFAKKDFGIAVVPYSLAKEAIQTGQLHEIKIQGLTFNRQISYIFLKGKILDHELLNLIEILKKGFNQN